MSHICTLEEIVFGLVTEDIIDAIGRSSDSSRAFNSSCAKTAECLQGIFPQERMKMINFHLLRHLRLHLDHRVE